MNKVFFMGRLTKDVEVKTTTNSKVVSFSIAINEGKDKEGNEMVTFANCEAWGRTAELIGEYFKKGKPINFEARLKNDKWEDEDGNKRSREKFVVNQLFFIPKDKDNSETEAPPTPKPRNSRKKKEEVEEFESTDEVDDDIPF